MKLRKVIWVVVFVLLFQLTLFYFNGTFTNFENVYSMFNGTEGLWQKIGWKVENLNNTEKKIHQNLSNFFTNLNMSEFQDFEEENCSYITWSFSPLMGLGNRMNVYATLYGLAKYNRKVPYIPNFDYDLDKIFHVSIRPEKLNPEPKFVSRDENGCCRFDAGSLHLECNLSIHLGGYRQSYKYFENYSKDLKNEFKFLNSVEKPCNATISNLKREYECESNDCILIGVHMRRGDFTYPHKMQFGHSPATEQYLKKAIEFFDHKFQNKKLLYVTLGNDYEWNFKNSRNITDSNIVVLKPQSAGIDLCILTKCNHTIASTGSFSWWAAYLTGGFVTYMKDQCRPGSSLCNEFELNDYINPQWGWVSL